MALWERGKVGFPRNPLATKRSERRGKHQGRDRRAVRAARWASRRIHFWAAGRMRGQNWFNIFRGVLSV